MAKGAKWLGVKLNLTRGGLAARGDRHSKFHGLNGAKWGKHRAQHACSGRASAVREPRGLIKVNRG